jgi:prepilin-type N-terminal cleavage/methylation domain-containing protein
MPPASSRHRADASGLSLTAAQAGFSLVEALMAMVVLAVALAGSSVALRGITSLLGRSGQLNASSLAIDNDISEIKRLASLYTACVVPTGSLPTGASAGCGQGLTPNQAAYFFPVDPGVNEANITAFFAACNSTSASSHITQGFITAIGQLPPVGAGVSRTSVAREAASDPKNHNVIVRYAAADGSIQRVIKVVPVLSAWCN